MKRFDRDRKRGEDLVQGILSRTSGPACGRALEQLPDLADGTLDATSRALVQGHLEHCAPCRQVAVVLGWLDGELPAMAAVDPGEAFTAAVLARTARMPSRSAAAGQLTGPASWMDRLGQWWSERIDRPLFAWQAAYALTVLLVALTALPGAPLQAVSGRLREAVQAGSGQGTPLGPVFLAVDSGVDHGAAWLKRAAWERPRTGLDRRLERTAPARTLLNDDIEGCWRDLRQGRSGPALVKLSAAAGDMRQAWSLWWRDDSQDSSQTRERRPS